PVIRRGGRLWRLFERTFVTAKPERRTHLIVASAAEDAHLPRADSWRWSAERPTDELNSGFCPLRCPLAQGGGPPVLLVRERERVLGVFSLSADGWSMRGTRGSPLWDHPEGTMGTRFVRDPQSESFVGLRSRCVPPPEIGSREKRRNVVEWM